MNARLLPALILALPGLAFAAKSCDVKAYGATGDGVTKDTAAIQKAIDDCAAAGGGTVVLAGAPMYVSGPLVLKSHITLSIATGTTLAGSEEHDDYPLIEELRESGRQPLLSSDKATDITINGGGTIDGRGQSWWPDRSAANKRPRLIVFRHSSHILMENITVQNSPSWQIVPYYSTDLVFRNMTVYAPDRVSHNTDGIDPFSSSHVLIEHVTIDTGDDNIAIKSGQPNSPGGDEPSHDIVIRDSTFLHGHGLSIGSEVAGGVYNVLAERIHFKGTGTGVRIKSNRDRGNELKHFVYRDLKMEDVNTPILISEFYPKIPDVIDSQPVGRLTPRFSDITIENLTATGARQAAIIVGLPESPVTGLKLTNVRIKADKGAVIKYAHMDTKGFIVNARQGHAYMTGPDMVDASGETQ
ncbi:Polygalacturonase precursor, putative [Ricinus communis]|uniref:Polygalacturonase, putative n=1 Tax=Ricinus communis TaxID=3988 RepID=B9TCU3_RICCO|nr:Polygalacturonase precursor, putative [Ricinus communis]